MPRQRAAAAPVYREIGARLRGLRRQASKTLAAASQELGISPQQLCKYERGNNRLPPDLTVRVACLYGGSCDFILRGGEGRDAA